MPGANYTIDTIFSCDALDSYDIGGLLLDDLLVDATPLSEALISQGCENTGASVTENGGLITIQIFGSCCCLGEAQGFDTWSASFEVIECPEIENIELRSDGGFELRSDGGLELRS